MALKVPAYADFAKIDELGGMVEAVKRNYPQREFADAAFVLQQEIDAHDRLSSASTHTPRAATA